MGTYNLLVPVMMTQSYSGLRGLVIGLEGTHESVITKYHAPQKRGVQWQ